MIKNNKFHNKLLSPTVIIIFFQIPIIPMQTKQLKCPLPPQTKQQLSHTSQIKTLQSIQQRISQHVILQHKNKNPSQSNLIMNCLKNHFVFYNLTQPQLQNVRDQMLYARVDEGEFVYQEGQETCCFFIVERGELEERVNGNFKKIFKPSDGFGEIAMLYRTQRNSAIKTLTQCDLWVIDRQLFKQAVEEVIIRDFQENRKCLENLRFFTGLSMEQKDLIASSLITKKFAKNQTIIKEGDPGSCFYYIKEGYASAYKGSKLVKKLMKGDSFGQQSLYYNTMRQLSIKADEQSSILLLPRDTLYKIMGEDIYQVTFKNFIMWSLENNSLFQHLKKKEIQAIIEKMKLSCYKVNETIFRKGVSGFQKLIVIIQGQLKNTRNGAIVAGKGQCFGEEFILYDNKNKIMEDEIIMNTYGVIAQLSDYKILQQLNLHRTQNLRSSTKLLDLKTPQKSASPLLHLPSLRQCLSPPNIENLYMVDKIKMGQFGPIFCIRNQQSSMMAMRCLNKKMLEEFEVLDFVLNEAHIFQDLQHTFVCGIGRKFHTERYLYELVEFVDGDDFDKVMEDLGLFSSKDCQFYAACILSILEYLYDKSIICRDLKPENFMVDSQGYLKLINMAVGKKVQKQGKYLGKTYTIIGTPHYMAPDIILGKGYNNMVDLWSLGVMMYEFLCGYLPFGDTADNAYEIYEEIMRNQLKFPEFLVDKRAKKLIQQFLSHNPECRLDGSFENIKENSWFKSAIDFQKLQERTISPQQIPYRPVKKYWKDSSTSLLEQIFAFEKDQEQNMVNSQQNSTISSQKWRVFGPYLKPSPK